MYIFRLISLLSLFLIPACTTQKKQPSSAQDTIVDSNTILTIQDYLSPSDYNKSTLILLDIDNTLGHPPTDLGSDQWFYAMVARHQTQGKTVQEAIQEVLPRYFQVMACISLVPTEPQTVAFINELQSKGITIVALTARSIGISERTAEQIRDMGIHLSTNLKHDFTVIYGNDHPAVYLNGIIFVGDHDKGEVLIQWMNKINYKPKKVIFIDDKMKNIVAVEHALHNRNYPFIGIRYGALDDHVNKFDIDQTDRELEQFLRNNPESRPVPVTL